jgi:hypothetical protein
MSYPDRLANNTSFWRFELWVYEGQPANEAMRAYDYAPACERKLTSPWEIL